MNLYQFQTLFLFLYTSCCTTKHHSVNFMLVTELQHALSEQQYSQCSFIVGEAPVSSHLTLTSLLGPVSRKS